MRVAAEVPARRTARTAFNKQLESRMLAPTLLIGWAWSRSIPRASVLGLQASKYSIPNSPHPQLQWNTGNKQLESRMRAPTLPLGKGYQFSENSSLKNDAKREL